MSRTTTYAIKLRSRLDKAKLLTLLEQHHTEVLELRVVDTTSKRHLFTDATKEAHAAGTAAGSRAVDVVKRGKAYKAYIDASNEKTVSLITAFIESGHMTDPLSVAVHLNSIGHTNRYGNTWTSVTVKRWVNIALDRMTAPADPQAKLAV